MRSSSRRLTVLGSTVLMLLWALSGVASAQEVTGSISASDQSGDGSTVTVAEATIEGAQGWINVHADSDGAPGPVIGTAPIPEGTSTNVVVTLDQPLTETATIWPMVHVDAGEVGTYEFPGDDVPVVVEGSIVMVPITYQVELPATGAPIVLLVLAGLGLIAGGLITARRARLSA